MIALVGAHPRPDVRRAWQGMALPLLSHPPGVVNPSLSTSGRISPTTTDSLLPRPSCRLAWVDNPTA
jgi:hypothetical protein